MSSQSPKFISAEARYLYEQGDVEGAKDVESRALPATGRVENAAGKVNPGKINGARLESFENGVVTLRVDDTNVLSFWLSIDIPLDKLEKFISQCKRDQDCE